MINLLRYGAIVLLIGLLSIPACKEDSVSPNSNALSAGDMVQIGTQEISPSGGNITISSSADTLDGLTMSIAPNSYGQNRSFRISYAPINSHTFGVNFHPLTPLIRISNGGGYADSIMILRIPVNIPAGHFAMAFAYDAASGALEGLPLLDEEVGYITVGSKHFAYSSMRELGNGILASDADFSDIVVSSVDTAVLMQNVTTPFVPGVDDFQFTNYGSYAEPDGHCAGQSVAMLWYYTQKKLKGSPSLFGRFDNDGVRKTPTLWQDDALGYRFCSMLQNDWNNSLSNRILEYWQGKNDMRTLRAFSYALRMTNEPQLAVIGTSNQKSRHAVVIYAIERGTLHVADPNNPGDKTTRRIRFDEFNRIYQPYFTAQKAGDPGTQYPVIHYMAKTSLVSWSSATEHWKSVANGSIGKGVFPDYTIVALNQNDEFVPLTNGFRVELGGRLTLSIRENAFTPTWKVFDKNGTEIPKDGSSLLLPTGNNLIGIVINDTTKGWVDFKWFNVDVIQGDGSEPGYGDIKLNLKVDGVTKTFTTATFEYNLYRLIRASGNGYELIVSPGDVQWGVKTLSLAAGSNYFWQEDGSVLYAASKPGTLSITQWSKNTAAGKFSFEAKNSNSGKTILVEGTFVYP